MESETQVVTALTALPAIVLAIAVVLFSAQFVLWRALRADPSDAPLFLAQGRGLIPCAVVIGACAVTIGLIAM